MDLHAGMMKPVDLGAGEIAAVDVQDIDRPVPRDFVQQPFGRYILGHIGRFDGSSDDHAVRDRTRTKPHETSLPKRRFVLP